jgi:hypothetical protein
MNLGRSYIMRLFVSVEKESNIVLFFLFGLIFSLISDILLEY